MMGIIRITLMGSIALIVGLSLNAGERKVRRKGGVVRVQNKPAVSPLVQGDRGQTAVSRPRFGPVCEIEFTGQFASRDNLGGFEKRYKSNRSSFSNLYFLAKAMKNMKVRRDPSSVSVKKYKKAVEVFTRFVNRKSWNVSFTKTWLDGQLDILEVTHGGLRWVSKPEQDSFIYRENSELLVTPNDCKKPCWASIQTVLGRGFILESEQAVWDQNNEFFVREFLVGRKKWLHNDWKEYFEVQYLTKEKLGYVISLYSKSGQGVQIWISNSGVINRLEQVMARGVIRMDFSSAKPSLPDPTQFSLKDQRSLVLIKP